MWCSHHGILVTLKWQKRYTYMKTSVNLGDRVLSENRVTSAWFQFSEECGIIPCMGTGAADGGTQQWERENKKVPIRRAYS